MDRRIRLLIPTLALTIWACTGGMGEVLRDAGQAMIDLGEAMEPDAGAHTGNEMRLTLPCTEMLGGGIYVGRSEPLNLDPTNLKSVTSVVCDEARAECYTDSVAFISGAVRAWCGGVPGRTAFVSIHF